MAMPAHAFHGAMKHPLQSMVFLNTTYLWKFCQPMPRQGLHGTKHFKGWIGGFCPGGGGQEGWGINTKSRVAREREPNHRVMHDTRDTADMYGNDRENATHG